MGWGHGASVGSLVSTYVKHRKLDMPRKEEVGREKDVCGMVKDCRLASIDSIAEIGASWMRLRVTMETELTAGEGNGRSCRLTVMKNQGIMYRSF